MIRVDVYSVLTIRARDPVERYRLEKLLRDKLVWANPAYQQAQEHSRYVSSQIPREIFGYTIHPAHIEAPRGFLYTLRKWSRDQGIKLRIKDRTIVRRAPTRFKYVTPVRLRDYQQDAVRACLRHSEGILQSPCGSGKTLMLTDLFRHLNQWTLILVHTDDLIVQMRERVERELGIKTGLIKQSVEDLQPITVASVMTLMRRELSKEFLEMWGCIALDEAHHMPAESFTKVIKQFPARYRFGTTATAKRADGLHGLMFYTIGLRVFNVPYETLIKGGYLMRPTALQIATEFRGPAIYGNIPFTRYYQNLLKALVNDPERNDQITDYMIEDGDHYNLVLSSRIDQLRALRKSLIKRDPSMRKRSALLIGAKTPEEREKMLTRMRKGKLNFIFATQIADEGLDVPILDRIHLVYPTRSERKVQQEVGRAQRTSPGKKDALIRDYRDVHVGVFDRQADVRSRIYRAIQCKVRRVGNAAGPRELVWTRN